MIYELLDTTKAAGLFAGWQETLIDSCFKKVMGKIFVTDVADPRSAYAYVGCFAFYAGEPDRELVMNKPEGFVIMTPRNDAWGRLIEESFPEARKVTRYAIRKDTQFQKDMLKQFVDELPAGYELHEIDADIYDRCLENPVTIDFVSSFESKEAYLKNGRGMVIIRKDRIVSGASSYARYSGGIEIEVDTVADEQRKGLATIACAALILRCLEENLYPSWDAQNMRSVHLAEKLGYEFAHEYVAYEID